MTTGALFAITAAIAAGVLLPKALPAALVRSRLDPRVERFLTLLPAALLAALTAIALLAGGRAAAPSWPAVIGVAAGAAVAAITRRPLLAMVCGWAALAVGLLLG